MEGEIKAQVSDQKYYKLVKEYPGHKIGDLAIYDPIIMHSGFVWVQTLKDIPKDFQPDITPEWFEESVFVTEDDKFMFVGDKYWSIEGVEFIVKKEQYSSGILIKRFSTKEAVDRYLNKLKYGDVIVRSYISFDSKSNSLIALVNIQLSVFTNIVYLGKSNLYGDVFKCWQDQEEDYLIYLTRPPFLQQDTSFK